MYAQDGRWVLTRWRVLRASSNWLWMYRLSFLFGFTLYQYLLFSIMGRVNNRESLYSVVTTVLLANISYVPFVRLPVFWKSSFQEWFPVSVLCCVQKHGAVRSGNRKRCRRRHKTDRIVLGNGTQDSRCRYFCIIAGQTGFSLRFLLKKMEDRVTARIPIRMYFRYFLI